MKQKGPPSLRGGKRRLRALLSTKITIALLFSAILMMASLLPFATAASDSTSTTATVQSLVAISVTPSISYEGNPGQNSGILTLTIDNIGSVDITSIEVRQYVDKINATSYNGTAFVQINDNGGLTIGTMSYGTLNVTTSTTVPGIITANIVNPSTSPAATYGVLTLVYNTTSVDGTSITRAVQFGFCWNGTDSQFYLDTDADGSLQDETVISLASLPTTAIALTEWRYDSTGSLTSRSVASVNVTAVGASGASVTFELQAGAYDAGALAVDGQKLCDYVIYIPNNVPAATYTGTIEFITTPS